MNRYLCVLAAMLCVVAEGQTVKVEPGKRDAVILAQRNHGINYAAEELAYHFEKLTGRKIRTIAEPGAVPEGAFVFSLGETAFAKRHGVSGEGLGHNRANFLGDDDKMILTGNDRGNNLAALLVDTSGTLFALYDILENDNGCHWLWPGELGECIPRSGCFKFKAGRREMCTKLKFFFWRQLWGLKKQWPSEKAFSHFMHEEVRWLLRHRSNRDLSVRVLARQVPQDASRILQPSAGRHTASVAAELGRAGEAHQHVHGLARVPQAGGAGLAGKLQPEDSAHQPEEQRQRPAVRLRLLHG